MTYQIQVDTTNDELFEKLLVDGATIAVAAKKAFPDKKDSLTYVASIPRKVAMKRDIWKIMVEEEGLTMRQAAKNFANATNMALNGDKEDAQCAATSLKFTQEYQKMNDLYPEKEQTSLHTTNNTINLDMSTTVGAHQAVFNQQYEAALENRTPEQIDKFVEGITIEAHPLIDAELLFEDDIIIIDEESEDDE